MFLRAAVKSKKERQVSDLQMNWYAQHLNQKGLSSVIAKMNESIAVVDAKKEDGELDPKFIKKQWSGLAMALGKLNRGRL